MGHDFNAFFNDTLPHYAFIINQRESTEVIKRERKYFLSEYDGICDKLKKIPCGSWTNCVKGSCYCYKKKVVQHFCPMDYM